MGYIEGTVTNKKGQDIARVKLKDVILTPASKFNLLSITKMMKEGWTIKGNKTSFVIELNGVTLNFDIIIRTQKGMLFCINIQRRSGEIGSDMLDVSKDKAHKLLGHSAEEATKASAMQLGWNLTGVMHKCKSCQEDKAKQKAVPSKSTHIPATRAGQRFYLDLSKIKKPTDVKSIGKQNWCMVVDEMSKLKMSSFHSTKDGMIDPTYIQMSKWRAIGLPVTNIRCDNAGENKKLEDTINGEKWKMNIKFEYTARDTP